MNFEKKIKDLLSSKEWTQELLAEKIGITRRTLKNYFDRNSLNTDELEKIADIFNVSVSYFFDENEKQLNGITAKNVHNGNGHNIIIESKENEIETLKKYVSKLETDIERLEKEVKKYKYFVKKLKGNNKE